MGKALAIAGLALLVVGCNSSDIQLRADAADRGSFSASDNMMGTITKATDQSHVGKKISFIGLNSKDPKVLFEGGSTSPLKKVFESDSTITLVLIASGSGSIESFVIDKRSGLFARAAAGSILGVYAKAEAGKLE